MSDKITIRTYSTFGKEVGGKYEVHFWGLTRYDQPCVVRVPFSPSVFCVLPADIEWNERIIDRLAKKIGDMLEKSNHKPYRFEYKKARPLYRSHEREDDCIIFYFRSLEAANHCSNLLKKPREYFRNEEFQIIVVEHFIDTVVKLLASKDIEYVTWIRAKGQLLEEDNSKRLTTEPLEYICDVDNIRQLDPSKTEGWKLPTPATLTFDIEANAENIFAMPKPLNPKDKVFMIGIKFADYTGKIKSYILTFVDISPVEGAKIIKYKDEYRMLNGFTDMVKKCNPDCITGHNIIGFDQVFMDKRMRNIYYKNWRNFSRYRDHDCKLIPIEWESSAYARMEMYYIDCPGRIILDTLFILRRTQKLESYKLDFVAKTFLGFGKLKGDESIEEVIDRTEKWKAKNKEKKKQAITATKTTDGHEDNDEEEDEEDYMTAHELFEYYRSGNPDNLRKAAIYCWGDCHATHEIFKELNIWVSITQLASVVFVDPFMIVTRGQQVRTVNQVYRQCVKDGKYVNREKANDIPFSGGSVVNPIPGLYEDVIVDDFTGLYPSIIRAYNISYDSYVKEGSYFVDLTKGEEVPDISNPQIPDEECNIAEWEEYVDMEKLKKKTRAKKKVIKELEEPDKDENTKGKRKKKEDIHHFKCRTRWLKKEGIMSRIARQISEARAAVKKLMALAEKGSYQYMLLNTTQEAQKVSNNSLFGGLGSKDGKLPLMEGAATITAMARKAIGRVGRYYRKKFGATVVYGDSVTKDTPVLCRINGEIRYYNISEIPRKYNWEPYGIDGEKEISEPIDKLEVWTEKGFTEIRKIIRHRTNKRIYRVLTHIGVVDVTEDHSLLDPTGRKTKPNEVDVGSELLHSSLPKIPEGGINIDKESIAYNCPYTMGLFYAGGSCSYYESGHDIKSIWTINSSNLKHLERAQQELNNYYANFDVNFIIYDTIESSAIYKLTAYPSTVCLFVNEWRNMFYDYYRQKKVPIDILNAPLDKVKLFFEGYYDGTGDKEYTHFDSKGAIGAAGLLFLADRMGYNSDINCQKDRPDIYQVTITKRTQRCEINTIKKLWNMGETYDYVYDLETENHHFSAGIGKIIVHNTDSAMVAFPKGFDFGGNIIAFGRKVAADITNELFANLKPMNLEMEKVLARFFIKGPKMYGYKQYNEDLTVNPVAVFKGLMNARRDNPIFLRNLASQVLVNVMDEVSYRRIVRHLTSELLRMAIYHGVPEKEMIVTQKIGSTYKSQTNALHIYSKHLLASGKTIQGGDRMPYLFVKIPQERIPGRKIYVGNKMELPELRRKTKAPIDYLYYLQKRCALFDDIMKIAYNEEKFIGGIVSQLQKHQAAMRQLRIYYNHTVDTVGINRKAFYPRYTIDDRINEINYALHMDHKYVNMKFEIYVTIITQEESNNTYTEKVRIRHNKTVTDVDFDRWNQFIYELLS